MIQIAALLAVADAVTTAIGLERGAVEANPVTRLIAPPLMLAVGIIATMFLGAWATRTKRPWVVCMCCLGLGLKAAAVVNNLIMLGLP